MTYLFRACCFALPAILLMSPLAAMTSSPQDKIIYGRLETVFLKPENLSIKAKLDTGAYRSSIHAQAIKPFTKGKEKWVKFDFVQDGKRHRISRKLLRMTKIKNRVGEANLSHPGTETRPVISLDVCLGNKQMQLETSLADRSNFTTALLIGRKAMLEYGMVIDPSLTHTTKAACHPFHQKQEQDPTL